LKALLAAATLAVKLTAKSADTGMRGDRGKHEARFEPVRRPACPARGANGFGAIHLSERSVKILVGFTPGTAPDLVARILADRFSEVWGTPFVVENIPGAGSNIATDRVAKAAADGYMLLMGGNSSLVISPSFYETLPFDPLKDFAPISQVFIVSNVLAVPSELPVKTVAELVALARAEPGKLSYGHAGVGTSQHLGAELFKHMARVDIAPVPYRGTTALMPDLLANRISMSFANIVNVVPLAREGKLRALAITSIKRSALAPDLPTMAESGFVGRPPISSLSHCDEMAALGSEPLVPRPSRRINWACR
jgi:tripartite-type tricarboxylate transporter receptor subunit TctC